MKNKQQSKTTPSPLRGWAGTPTMGMPQRNHTNGYAIGVLSMSSLCFIGIQNNEDNVSILTTKTAGENQYKVVVGSQVASGSNPVSGPTANSTPPRAASGGSEDLPSAGTEGRANGGPAGK